MLCFFFLFFVLLLTLYCDLFWQLAKQGEGKVFATDTIVATLMACARSQYSWDIVVTVMEETVIVLISIGHSAACICDVPSYQFCCLLSPSVILYQMAIPFNDLTGKSDIYGGIY